MQTSIYILLSAGLLTMSLLFVLKTTAFIKFKRATEKDAKRNKYYFTPENQKVIEAFTLNEKKYFMYEDATKVPSGRGLAALTIYEEFNMRCTREYLQAHTRAMEILLSDPKKINIQAIAVINKNLSERLSMAIFPDHIYKLASVLFFDESESPYGYDYQYNNKKIEEWKVTGGSLDFFMKTPLKDLIPSLQLQGENADTYFQVSQMIDHLHRTDLQEQLSKAG